MKIVCLIGGLGNQMFQYAFGIVLGKNTVYDASWFNAIRGNADVTQREYELDFWNVKPKLITRIPKKRFLFIRIRPKCINENPRNIYNPQLLKIKRGVFSGYFQAAQYYEPIRERLLAEFTPKNEPNTENAEILDLIRSTNSVSLHVRRGDYVDLQHIHGLCDLDYYKRAIDFIAERESKPHFFIFSDDTQWVTDNLKPEFPYTIVDINHGRNSAWDMWLMANCKHNIIANSSFSWWGAWLNQNPDKIVIAPKLWKIDGTKTDIVPTNWTKM